MRWWRLQKVRVKGKSASGKGLKLEKGSGWHWLTLWNVPGSLFQVTMSVLAIQALVVIKGLLSLSAKLNVGYILCFLFNGYLAFIKCLFIFLQKNNIDCILVIWSQTTVKLWASFELTPLFSQITPMSHSSDGICHFSHVTCWRCKRAPGNMSTCNWNGLWHRRCHLCHMMPKINDVT